MDCELVTTNGDSLQEEKENWEKREKFVPKKLEHSEVNWKSSVREKEDGLVGSRNKVENVERKKERRKES